MKLIFLIKPFFYVTKKPRQKLKYLEKKKSYWSEIKSVFHQFWRVFSCQKLFQTWQYTFKYYQKVRQEYLPMKSCSIGTRKTIKNNLKSWIKCTLFDTKTSKWLFQNARDLVFRSRYSLIAFSIYFHIETL